MKILYFIIIFLIAAFIPLGGCNSIDENDPREDLFNGVAFSETGNSDVPAIAVHENGEWYGVLNDRSGDGIAGAVYGDGNGNRFAVYLGEDGNPEKAYCCVRSQ